MIRPLFLFIMALLLNGCASTVISMMKDQPAFNWTYIPKKGLKKGDSSTYQSFKGDQSWKFEVADVLNDSYLIRMNWLHAPQEVAFLKDISYEFTVGKDGFTRAAYLIDGSGERTLLRIAGPGDFGFTQDHKPLKLQTPETVETPLGKFEVSEVIVYSMKDRSTIGGTISMTCVSFVNDQAPFGYVSQTNTATIKLPFSDLLDFVSMVSPMNKTYKSLTKFLLSFSENSTVSAGNHIVDLKH